LPKTRGYYTRHGVDVNIIPGGPSVAGMALLVANKRFLAISDPPSVSAAVAEGGDVKIIGAGYQTNPACIMSLASKPINTPADLKGKTIGVGAADDPEWHAFLEINNIALTELTTVPAGFDTSPAGRRPMGRVSGLPQRRSPPVRGERHQHGGPQVPGLWHAQRQ